MSRRTLVPASILAALFTATATLASTPVAYAADEAAKAALPATVSTDDPVALGFGRMLAHAPNTAAPKVPAGLGEDPLLAAVLQALHGVRVAKLPKMEPRAQAPVR